MDGWLFWKMLYNIPALHCMAHFSRERAHSMTERMTWASCTLAFQMFEIRLTFEMTGVSLQNSFAVLQGKCAQTHVSSLGQKQAGSSHLFPVW